MRKNNKNWMGKMIAFKVTGLALMSLVVLLLWNNIVTEVIGWKAITYLQSLGLLLLFRILTGNIGPRNMHGAGGMMHRKGWMKERWKNMSEEEKKQWMRGEGRSTWSKECEDKTD